MTSIRQGYMRVVIDREDELLLKRTPNVTRPRIRSQNHCFVLKNPTRARQLITVALLYLQGRAILVLMLFAIVAVILLYAWYLICALPRSALS